MIPTEREMQDAIRAHMQATGETAACLSLRVSRDKHLIRDVLAGRRQPRLGLARKIMLAIQATASRADAA